MLLRLLGTRHEEAAFGICESQTENKYPRWPVQIVMWPQCNDGTIGSVKCYCHFNFGTGCGEHVENELEQIWLQYSHVVTAGGDVIGHKQNSTSAKVTSAWPVDTCWISCRMAMTHNTQGVHFTNLVHACVHIKDKCVSPLPLILYCTIQCFRERAAEITTLLLDRVS